MSLRWRIVLGLALIAALVIGAGSAAAYINTSRQLHASVDQSLATRAADADGSGPGRGRYPGGASGPGRGDTAPEDGGAPGGRPGYRHDEYSAPCASANRPPVDAAQLVGADGTVTACRDGSPALPTGPAELDVAEGGGPSSLRTISVDGVRYRLLTTARREGGALQVARDLTEVDDVLDGLRQRLTGLGLAGVAAASLLGWLVARRVVRPVERLRDAAERIARTQDLATPLPAGGSGEVGSLARSLGTMVGALATSREQQQRLVTDASHELRTPLTSLRTNVELLRRAGDLPGEQRREVLADLQFEVEELTHLVAELVELATDRAGEDEPVEAVSLAELARSVATRAQRRTGRPVEVSPIGPRGGNGRPEGLVQARPQRLERAIANLVDNALKYTTVGDGPVEVAVDGNRLEVRDRGPGIPVADQSLVFDRFYRSTTARTEPGSGLGLAIVRQIIEGHGGRVWATDRPGGGAAVGFELPAGNGPAGVAAAAAAAAPAAPTVVPVSVEP